MDAPQDVPSDLIRSVSRALRVLEVVGDSPSGLTAKQVARRSQLALSTTYHLLRTLCYEGYLRRRPAGLYVLGLGISDRFRDLARALGQPPEVRAVLQHLAAVTGHSAYLSRIIDGRVVITELVEAPGSPKVEDLIVGFSESAHATALGKALLASMSRPARRRFLGSQGLPRLTSRTVTDPDQLEYEITEMSSAGTFEEVGQFRDEVSCIAALVRPGSGGKVWGSVALSSSSARFERFRASFQRELRLASADLAGRTN